MPSIYCPLYFNAFEIMDYLIILFKIDYNNIYGKNIKINMKTINYYFNIIYNFLLDNRHIIFFIFILSFYYPILVPIFKSIFWLFMALYVWIFHLYNAYLKKDQKKLIFFSVIFIFAVLFSIIFWIKGVYTLYKLLKNYNLNTNSNPSPGSGESTGGSSGGPTNGPSGPTGGPGGNPNNGPNAFGHNPNNNGNTNNGPNNNGNANNGPNNNGNVNNGPNNNGNANNWPNNNVNANNGPNNVNANNGPNNVFPRYVLGWYPASGQPNRQTTSWEQSYIVIEGPEADRRYWQAVYDRSVYVHNDTYQKWAQDPYRAVWEAEARRMRRE